MKLSRYIWYTKSYQVRKHCSSACKEGIADEGILKRGLTLFLNADPLMGRFFYEENRRITK